MTILLLRNLGPSRIVSTPFMNSLREIQFREPSPKNRSPYSRFLFVREVLLTKFPLWHSYCLDLYNSLLMHGNWGIESASSLTDCRECYHFCDVTLAV